VKINFLYIIILSTFFSCTNTKSYKVHGTIIEIRKELNQLLIHHDEIPGFMMKMTMPFNLADSQDVNRFKIGDSLKFTFVVSKDDAFAKDLNYAGIGTLPNNNDFFDDEYEALDIGEIFTDITLLDIDSNKVLLSNSDGKFRLITYIFTRCPMPNMCPAAVVKNQYLAQEFIDESKIELILISFDYIYDTPSILKKKYYNILKSNSNIKIYSSYGHVNDIFTLAGQSFVSFWGIDENDIGHSMRSVLLDPERRFMKAYEGLEWKPETTKMDIVNLLKTYSNNK
tara:strand:- start:194 stop:1042 length:849 start_codon:yes stop_codon:yes gene_type:complete